MSERLAAVTGATNKRCFKPHAEWKVHRRDKEIEMGEENLEKCLLEACLANGYRTIEVDTCVFKGIQRINGPICAATAKPQEPETIAELDSVEGEMSLVEVNV